MTENFQLYRLRLDSLSKRLDIAKCDGLVPQENDSKIQKNSSTIHQSIRKKRLQDLWTSQG